jgi:sec-independent protein translocase protein TatB
MFDLGFPELVTIFVIALVVLGPKRMAELAGKVGKWVGKARSMARQFRQQLESEIDLDDLNRATKKQTQEAQQAPAATPDLSNIGYPYGPPEPEPVTESAAAPAATPQPGDDTFSHAHEAGGAPMLETADESAAPAEPKSDSPSA